MLNTPNDVTCPKCFAAPGQSCTRPRGVVCKTHSARVAAAKALDVEQTRVHVALAETIASSTTMTDEEKVGVLAALALAHLK